jgi:hypothetical protein
LAKDLAIDLEKNMAQNRETKSVPNLGLNFVRRLPLRSTLYIYVYIYIYNFYYLKAGRRKSWSLTWNRTWHETGK